MHEMMLDTLIERCSTLGLALWSARDQAAQRLWPEPDDIVLPDSLDVFVQEAITGWQAGDTQRTIEPRPGCTLFLIGQDAAKPLVAVALDQRIHKSLAIDPSAERLLSTHPPDNARLSTLLGWLYEDQAESLSDIEAMDEFSSKLIQSYEETRLIYRVSRMLNATEEPRQSLEAMVRQILSIQPFDWVALAFSTKSSVPQLAGFQIIAGEMGCDHEQFRERLTQTVDSIKADSWSRVLDPDTHPLAELANTVILAEPIHHDDDVVGIIAAGNRKGDEEDVSSVEVQFFDATSEFLGTYHENLARFAEQEAMFIGTLKALTASLDAKDPYTRGHSERVALISQQIARKIGLSEHEAERVRIAGLVHDVGKIGVPERVLLKNGRLDDEEFEQIKKHPEIGYRILKDVPPLDDVRDGVLTHHERYDGRGYPQGLTGDSIPLYGRILALADTFDAMSSTRSYRAALDREKVIAEIERCAGSQFDPDMAKAFLRIDLRPYDMMLDEHKSLSDFETVPQAA
ncbi:MAG: HD-GYP domain-containing protein [Phycisphaeraceae bacterium]